MKIITDFGIARKMLSRQTPDNTYPVSGALKQRLQNLFGTNDPEQAVKTIITEVRNRGNNALFELTQRIDGSKLDSLEVRKKEVADAYRAVERELVSALQEAARRIESFHRRQRESLWHEIVGKEAGQQLRPLQRVGIYVPGGTATYPSTVLMTAIPSRVAGVSEIIMTTPPAKDGKVPPITLVAADIARVDRIFSIGGAQAIAAMAYGTETIPAVDKVYGPGNIFVMLAKKLVFGTVDIDGLQGPSEVMIVTDATTSPEYCAADILAQAEHDVLASTILVTTSRQFADAVNQELEKQVAEISRKDIVTAALARGITVIVSSLEQAVEIANLYAPEHLCLMLDGAERYVKKIKNAGCIVVGRKATVVLGDYTAGPSHALPTGGTARFSSPLNVSDFVKYTSVINVNEDILQKLGPPAAIIARAEGLDAHARAIERRLQKD
ncbi:histidinol dehydrogenase [Chloroflexota bacterium]